MKLRYRLFLRRKSVYYAFDKVTKRVKSLKTKDKAEAARIIVALNESDRLRAMNLKLARIYLRHANPLFATRTWQHVFDEIIRTKTGETQKRWITASKSRSFDTIRNLVLIETQAEHLLRVMNDGKMRQTFICASCTTSPWK